MLLFGSLSILLNVFQISYSAILIECKSGVDIVFPSIEIIFICAQVLYFIPLEIRSFSLSHSWDPKGGRVGIWETWESGCT